MRYEVQQLRDGWPGTDHTVKTIVRLVNESVTDPVVRRVAENIVRDIPERDKLGEIRAISRFVRSRIRYTGEPVETIKTPRVLVDEIQRYGKATGDCDDHVVLALALHRMVGTQCDIPVISQRADGIANHIYIRCFVPGRGWVTDDLIMKKEPLGWEPPSSKVTKKKTYLAPAGPSLIPAISALGCCGGSCSRSVVGLLPESGVGQVEIIVAGISAAATAASLAAQLAMQKKALKTQEKAMDQAQKQFEQQREDQAAAIAAANSLEAPSSGGGWGVALGVLAIGGAALYLLTD